MTPEQIKLVQQSFAKIEPIVAQTADRFYDRLFETAPGVRPLFPDEMSGQKLKLMQMLSTAVANLHQVDKIVPAVADLGRRHAGYGTRPEHYDAVGDALLWSLERGLGDGFTPEVREAWATTYKALAGVMKEAAIDPAEPEP